MARTDIPARLAVHPGQSLVLDDKPLPSVPSPTLTNPDMVLPDAFETCSNSTSTPRAAGPPSPSYLLQQHGQRLLRNGRKLTYENRDGILGNGASHQRSGTTSRRSASGSRSPAMHAPHIYEDVTLGSSPTLNGHEVSASRRFRNQYLDDGRRVSLAASSINSEDLDAMRIPDFAGSHSDTETLGDDLEIAQSEASYGGKHIGPSETEQSSVTLMRAEMILANAKKRLNLMDQNLRGARESIAPLTAANLKRAASLNSAFAQPAYYHRAKYTLRDQQADATGAPQTSDGLKHYRGLSDPATFGALPERPATSLTRANPNRVANPRAQGPPVNRLSLSWTSNPLRGGRSQEHLRVEGQTAPIPLHMSSPEPPLETLQEDDTSHTSAGAPQRAPPRRASTANGLREQMHELQGRISTLKERARENNLRRKSMQSLRYSASPFTDAGAPLSDADKRRVKRVSSAIDIGQTRDYFLSDISSIEESQSDPLDLQSGYAEDDLGEPSYGISPPERFHTPEYDGRSSSTDSGWLDNNRDPNLAYGSSDYTFMDESDLEHDETNSVYEDAPVERSTAQRHEDRDDAFDYSTFFLHSAMGNFSRPRGTSTSSSGSASTARGPAMFDDVPSTPETPETLREIERALHRRAPSTDSVGSMATFETAQEGYRSGRQTPMALADPRRAHKDGYGTAMSGRLTASSRRSTEVNARYSRRRDSTAELVNPSRTTLAVSSLLDSNARSLGLKDKALVFTLMDSLRSVCEKLQNGHDTGHAGYVLRRRLDDARRALDGIESNDAPRSS